MQKCPDFSRQFSRRVLLCLVGATLFCSTAPRPTWAQTVAEKSRAVELVKRGAEQFARGNYLQTVELCREAARNDGKYVRAYTWLGAAYQKTGRNTEARNAFGRVLQLAPKSDDAKRAQRGLRELNALVKKSSATKPPKYTPKNYAATTNAANRDEQPLLRWRASASGLRALSWSPDGQRLASGGADKTLRLWDARNGASLGAWQGHTGEISDVAWSPDGKWLASSSYDNTVRVWRSNGAPVRTLEGDGYDFNVVAWGRDSQQLAGGAGDGKIWVWDATSGASLRLMRGHDNGVTDLQFGTLGGRNVLLSSGLDATVRLWDMGSGRALQTLSREGPAVSALSADAQHFASANGNLIRVHNSASPLLIRSLDLPRAGGVQALAWSPGGNILAAGYYQSAVRLWDVRDGNFRVLRGLQSGARCVEFSPDGQFLAAAAQDGTIAIWKM